MGVFRTWECYQILPLVGSIPLRFGEVLSINRGRALTFLKCLVPRGADVVHVLSTSGLDGRVTHHNTGAKNIFLLASYLVHPRITTITTRNLQRPSDVARNFG